jgi:competence protein CoiA
MKFALVDGQRQEPQRGLPGECPACRSPMIPKCGEVRTPHWAHKGRRHCDPWWENETDWHRAWKNQFPVEWQEIVHPVGDGERHIADVKTDAGWVIEFQHSHLKPEERRSREAFYKKLVWVVDGTRLKRDGAQFQKAWEEGTPLPTAHWPIRRVFSDKCRLLGEWSGSSALVLLDFGDALPLGWLVDKRPNGPVHVAPFGRAGFIELHRGTSTQDFDSFVKDLPELVATIATYESRPAQVLMPRLRYDPLHLPRQYRRRRF